MKRLEYEKVSVYTTYFDRNVEPGELMIGHKQEIVKFLCPCGCGSEIDLFEEAYFPRKGKNWTITVNDNKVTLHPSVNMVNHKCKSHFWIVKNKVVWV